MTSYRLAAALRLLPLLAALFCLTIAGARADESAQSADLAVKACLELVQKNVDSRPPHEEDELTEKTGPKGRLDAARAAAAFQAESCIGVAAAACIQAEGNTSTAVMTSCYESEAEAWDSAPQRGLQEAPRQWRRRRRCGGLPQDATGLDGVPGRILRAGLPRVQGNHGSPDDRLLQAQRDGPAGDLAGRLAALKHRA